MAKQRVLVIGAGVLGLFTAFELLRDGEYDVTVIDKGHPGGGSSGRSVGMVETQYFTRPTVEVRAFGRRAFEGLEKDHGLSFEHGGYLRLGHSPLDIERFADSIDIQAEFGITDVELLTQEQMAQRWPQIISEGLLGGLFGSWDGFVDGYEVCQLLTSIVRSQGGKVVTGTAMTAATHGDGAWSVSAGNTVYAADFVVNAAGPHAGVVGDMLGAPVPLLPQLHGAITIRLASLQTHTPFVMDYMPGTGVDGVYFRSEGPGFLIAGLHTEEAISESVDPDIPLRSVTEEVLERIAMLLMERLKDAADLEPDRSWQGIYPMTPDHQPIVGAHPAAPGVICALGAGGSGIQLSPAIGRLAADAIRGTTHPVFEIAEEWLPGRFV